MEHRQQMWALKRTHLFPDLGRASLGGIERKRDTNDDELNHNLELRRLARAFHMHPEELVDKYDETRREVRHLHMDIYYRPDAAQSTPASTNEQVELSANAMQERFASIGFADPDAAMRHVHRTDRRHLPCARKSTASSCPPPSNGSAKGQNPDMGLLQLAQTGRDTLARTAEYLGFLRDSAVRRATPVPHPVQFAVPGRRAQQIRRIRHLARQRQRPAGHAHAKASDVQTHARHSNATAAKHQRLRHLHPRHATPRNRTHRTRMDERCHRRQGVARRYDRRVRCGHRRIAHLGHPPPNRRKSDVDEPRRPAIAVIGMGRYGGQRSELQLRRRRHSSSTGRPMTPTTTKPTLFATQSRRKTCAPSCKDRRRSNPKSNSTWTCGPEGKNGPARALLRVLRGILRFLGGRHGSTRRSCVRVTRQATRRSREDFLMNVADPLRYPKIGFDGGADRRTSASSRRVWKPSDCRAACVGTVT